MFRLWAELLMEQIYLEWRDAVGKSHHTNPDGDKPHSVLLRGVAWLVEETETDVIVAAYVADDAGFMDMVAIPKTSIERREAIEAHSSSSDEQKQVSPRRRQSPQ